MYYDRYDIYLHTSSNNLALNATMYLLSLGTEIKVSSHLRFSVSYFDKREMCPCKFLSLGLNLESMLWSKKEDDEDL